MKRAYHKPFKIKILMDISPLRLKAGTILEVIEILPCRWKEEDADLAIDDMCMECPGLVILKKGPSVQIQNISPVVASAAAEGRGLCLGYGQDYYPVKYLKKPKKKNNLRK